jgi:uncharacterized protein YraI
VAAGLFALPAPTVCAAENAPYAFEVPYRVVTASPGGMLNLRTGPGITHPFKARLPNGTAGLFLLACSKDARWCRVKMDRTTGWVFMRYLQGYAD